MQYYNGNMTAALSSIYSEHTWKSTFNIPSISKHQLRIFQLLQDLYHDQLDIHMNYQLHHARFSESSESMQLDIFIPSLKLAIEYQGMQHFKEQGFDFISLLNI